MKKQLTLTALLVLSFSGISMAQNKVVKAAVAQGAPVTIPLASGTAINASLVGVVDSEKSKPGDPVTAIVTEAVTYQRCVLLPKGSRISGRVVRTGGDGNESSAVFVEFDRAILKDGKEAVLNAGIQALAPAAAAPTIPSREKYEENRMAGAQTRGISQQDTVVLPSNYAMPRRSPQEPQQKLEGGLDRKGMFTPDSKGAFAQPGVKLFTPMSEGSHGTVLVGTKQNVRLENGTRLLIVVQPPAGQ
jgi:hypothetical protein